MADRIPLSQEGYDKLLEKLRAMRDVERPRLEKALGDAREKGDLSENAEFDVAREELWIIDRKIGEMEERVAHAYVVDKSKLPKGVVAFGSRVKVKDRDTGDIEVYVMVGEGESDPAVNRISTSSPLAQGMMGSKVGDVLKIQTPGGILNYEVLEIAAEL